MLKNFTRYAIQTVAAAILAILLYNGWYYWQVLKWVDGVRIQQALQQVAAQQTPKAP